MNNYIYNVTPYDLRRFNIVYNDSSEEVAYRNKIGFSLLFAAVKNSGYKGIKLYKRDNDVCYISYKANMQTTATVKLLDWEYAGYELCSDKNNIDIFDNITLENANESSIKSIPVDTGGILWFVIDVYEDTTIIENEPDRYVRKGNNGVYFDTTDQQLICIKKYRIAPILPGKPLKYINPDELPLSYFNTNKSKIMSGEIYEELGEMVDASTDEFQYTYNGEEITPTVPIDRDITAFVFRDEAHIARNPENPDIIYSIWQGFDDDENRVCWPGMEDGLQFQQENDGTKYLRPRNYLSFVNSNLSVTERYTINGQVYSISLPYWQSGIIAKKWYVVFNNSPLGAGFVGGNNIYIPTDFTIDFNNITLKAVGIEQLHNGKIIYPNDCKNTHVKNVIIDGGLKEFNFYKSYLLVAGPTNGYASMSGIELGTIGVRGCNFCSFVNVICKNVIGYDGGTLHHLKRSDVTNAHKALTEVGYIDKYGNVITLVNTNVDADDPIATGDVTKVVDPTKLEKIIESNTDAARAIYDNGTYIKDTLIGEVEENGETISVDKEPYVGLIHTGLLTVDGDAGEFISIPVSGGTYSSEIQIESSYDINEKLVGKRDELFVHFYDNNGTYITTVKTEYYRNVRVPTGATKIKLSVYGVIISENDNRIVSTSYTYNYKRKVPQAFYNLVVKDYDSHCSNILFDSVIWYNTRSTTAQTNSGHTHIYKNCEWHNCSRIRHIRGSRYSWNNNPYAIDFEEGKFERGQVCLINCLIDNDTEEYPANDAEYVYIGHKSISTRIYLYPTKNLIFAGCVGFRIEDLGGVSDAAFINNNLQRIKTILNNYGSNKGNIYIDNKIGELKSDIEESAIVYQKPTDGDPFTRLYEVDKIGPGYFEPNRRHRSDDPIIVPIPIFGTCCAVDDNSDKFNVLNGSLKSRIKHTIVVEQI